MTQSGALRKQWESITSGALISFSDRDSIADMPPEHRSAKDEYVAKSVWTLREKQGLATWILVFLENAFMSAEDALLMVKIVGDEVSLLRYYIQQSFPPGNRQQFCESDGVVFFEGYEPSTADFSRLPFAPSFELDYGNGPVRHTLKPQGPLYADTRIEPNTDGWRLPVFTSVVEYLGSTSEAPLPNILLLELGGENNRTGGHIMVFAGYEVRAEEVEGTNAVSA